MIRVEIIQELVMSPVLRTARRWECEIRYHHVAEDGETATEVTTMQCEWFEAVKHAHMVYGDNISSLSVEYARGDR
jgi:hypothetical protein